MYVIQDDKTLKNTGDKTAQKHFNEHRVLHDNSAELMQLTKNNSNYNYYYNYYCKLQLLHNRCPW